jgi:hypothetical protein
MVTQSELGERILTTGEAARFLRRQQQTLRKWRMRGGGPPYVRIGGVRGRVGYVWRDLQGWLAARTFESTSAETVAACERG